MTDANGIDIVSAKDIVFSAENDLKIKGKTISIEAGAPVSQPAAGATPPGLYLNTGLASIILKEDVANIYGKPVKLEGTNKAPCPQPEEVEEDAEEEESGLTAEDWKDIGLAVAGCIPIVGSVVSVGEALSEAYNGNYVDAGISLSGVIPFAGTAGKVAKFAKKGKIAGKILNLLNKGKNLAKRVFKKIAKKAKALGGKMKTLSSHMMADARKAIENAAKMIAGKTGKGKAGRLAENRKRGRDFEIKSLEKMKKNNDNVVEQITVRTKSGTKTRLDGIGVDKKTGEIVIEEYKASPTASLTKNQKIAHPEIAESGATVVGKGKEPFVGGTEIPPTKITIIRDE